MRQLSAKMQVGWREHGRPQWLPGGRDGQWKNTGPTQREPGSSELCDLSPGMEVTCGQGSQPVPGDLTGASEGNHNRDLPLLCPAVRCTLSIGPAGYEAARTAGPRAGGEAPPSTCALQADGQKKPLAVGFLFPAVHTHDKRHRMKSR